MLWGSSGAYALPGPLGRVPGDGDLRVVVDVLVDWHVHGIRLGHGIRHLLVNGHRVGPVNGHGHSFDDWVGLGYRHCVRLRHGYGDGLRHVDSMWHRDGHLLDHWHSIRLVDGHRLRNGHSVAAESRAVVSQASTQAGRAEAGRVVWVAAEVDAALRLCRIVVVCGGGLGGLGGLIFISQRHRQWGAEQTQLWNKIN